MRIEKKELGVRYRVIFNKTEVYNAGLEILYRRNSIKREDMHNNIRFFIGITKVIYNDYVNHFLHPLDLENELRKLAKDKIEIPNDAEFKVGLNEGGALTGCTFQFSRLNESV
jgi:hypothetical protein